MISVYRFRLTDVLELAEHAVTAHTAAAEPDARRCCSSPLTAPTSHATACPQHRRARISRRPALSRPCTPATIRQGTPAMTC